MSTTTAQPAAQRQQLITVEGLEGYFATIGGREISGDTSPVWDGGSKTPEQIGGPATPGNLTLGRPYRPARDQEIMATLRQQVMRWRTTISVQDTDEDLVPIGRPVIYANALLVRLADPDGDAASSDPSMIELEFAVTTVA